MATMRRMKLYRPSGLPDHLVGEDRAGGLCLFPASPGGWARRTPWAAGLDRLEEVSVAEARGTKWPGAIGGAPRAGKPARHQIAVRVTDDERAAWAELATGHGSLAGWIRKTCNAAVAAARAGRVDPGDTPTDPDRP